MIITGNYSRLACEIQFVRSMGYYLIQVYIPSSLIVIISWVSFWLNRGATPARVGLGVTTVLTMTTLMASTNAALPKISYVKSIDVYLGACFFMVFASLLGKFQPKKRNPVRVFDISILLSVCICDQASAFLIFHKKAHTKCIQNIGMKQK